LRLVVITDAAGHHEPKGCRRGKAVDPAADRRVVADALPDRFRRVRLAIIRGLRKPRQQLFVVAGVRKGAAKELVELRAANANAGV
jgi:hypothetical protein